MSLNALQIGNTALIKLGLPVMSSFDDKTPLSEVVRLRFAPLRDLILRNHAWHFAKKRITLYPISGEPSAPWAYAMQLPADHGRTLSITDGSDSETTVKYERMGRYLLTSCRTLSLVYVINIGDALDDKMSYPADFAECLGCYLAADLAPALTKDAQLQGPLLRQYETALTDSRHNGSIDTYQYPGNTLWTDEVSTGSQSPASAGEGTWLGVDGRWSDFTSNG